MKFTYSSLLCHLHFSLTPALQCFQNSSVIHTTVRCELHHQLVRMAHAVNQKQTGWAILPVPSHQRRSQSRALGYTLKDLHHIRIFQIGFRHSYDFCFIFPSGYFPIYAMATENKLFFLSGHMIQMCQSVGCTHLQLERCQFHSKSFTTRLSAEIVWSGY